MRWNPFQRPSEEDAVESAFESTVVEDLPHGLDQLTHDARAEAAARLSTNIGHVGRYALKSVLGEGGLGTVYAAWDPLLSRAVAVKTLQINGATEQLGVLDDLILNEARAAARLSHPHIVTIHDAGTSDQGIYIAMEPLRGRDLRHMLREGWRPDPVETANLGRRVADALAYAHGKGVVHCDIKPANIFMVGRKQPKVLDFGIARVTHGDAPTTDGPTAGSPYYLAPEQLAGGPIDRRTDVYSLGVVLFELLTGQRPFTGRTMAEIAHAVQQTATPTARDINPEVPAGLSAIVAQAMARNPAHRHASARILSLDLRHWLDSAEAQSVGQPIITQPRRKLAAVFVLALAAGGATAWLQSTHMDRAMPMDDSGAAPAASTASALPVIAPPTPLSETASATDVATPDTTSASAHEGVAMATEGAMAAPSAPVTALPPADARRPTPAPERDARRRSAPAALPVPAPAPSSGRGTVQLAISPWGTVSVDGQEQGTSPPLRQLQLSTGVHTITIRNGDLPAVTRTIEVSASGPVTVQHRFGP